MAFQIQDDILDVTSTTEMLGKPVHSDEKNEKTTYVTLKGTDESGREVERLTTEALGELKELGRENEFLNKLLEWPRVQRKINGNNKEDRYWYLK